MPRTTQYPVSGGIAEMRSFDRGEGSTIEHHKEGRLAVTWSTEILAPRFMYLVGALLVGDTGVRATLLPQQTRRKALPFDKARTAVEQHQHRFQFITVTTRDSRSFVWGAANPLAETSEYPYATGECGIVLTSFDRDLIGRLIQETATAQVSSDLPSILASAEQITSNTHILAA
jgi:hypothetical protein